MNNCSMLEWPDANNLEYCFSQSSSQLLQYPKCVFGSGQLNMEPVKDLYSNIACTLVP